ncbi:MAG: uracil phosphoribosyltransferase [Dysgonamonadaceae bacterium]|jgi:uracil phosphoribosyltransferase|nr:uracil phosphoribosyltransferase [Dysgonamonadaceae bacterium]
MNIHNLSEKNSVLHHFLAEIRDVNVHNDRLRFRKNIERIGEIMAYEISQTMNYQLATVQTPLGVSEIPLIADQVVIATVLRAGLPFHNGFLEIFDSVENAFVSASRKYNADHTQFEIVVEYLSSPSIEGKTLLIVDPMLATGGSLDLAYKALLTRGEPAHIHVACVIASQQGIDTAIKLFPKGKTTIWAAAIDPGLNEHAYIVPGLGDAGDLAYGEKL